MNNKIIAFFLLSLLVPFQLKAAIILDWPLTSSGEVLTGLGVTNLNRTSDAWIPDINGVYHKYESGELSYDSRGVLIESYAQNLCTNYNAQPDAAISNVSVTKGIIERVDRSQELAAAGLGNICPQYVFQYYNDTESPQTITITGHVGSRSSTSYRTWAMIYGGEVTMQLTGGDGQLIMSESTGFVRWEKYSVTPSDPTDQLEFVVPPGVTFEWILNQMSSTIYGAALGTPIVSEGAVGERDATTVILNAAYLNFPANDFTIYFEFTPNSYHYQYNNAGLINLYAPENDYLRIDGLGGQITLRKQDHSSGKRYDTGERVEYISSPDHTSRCAIRVSSTDGLTLYLDGAKSISNTNTDDIELVAQNLRIGQNQDGSRLFSGWVGHVRVYDEALSDGDIQAMTKPEFLELGKRGLPVYQSGTCRIWSSGWDGEHYNGIYYSDDWGLSWMQWSPQNIYTGKHLSIDSRGNLYYSTPTGLFKVNASTRQKMRVITWDKPYGDALGKTWSWIGNWAWAEDDAAV